MATYCWDMYGGPEGHAMRRDGIDATVIGIDVTVTDMDATATGIDATIDTPQYSRQYATHF